MSGGILGHLPEREWQPRPFDWAAVDLRPGSPFGKLLAALLEWAQITDGLTEKRVGAPRRGRKVPKTFYADYLKARSKWPEAARCGIKPICRLMHAHSRTVFGGRYNDVKVDALSKQVAKYLKLVASAEKMQRPLPLALPQDPNLSALWFAKTVKGNVVLRQRGLRARSGK
jgi:hypothetical protein